MPSVAVPDERALAVGDADGRDGVRLLPLHTAIRGRARFRIERLRHDERATVELVSRLGRCKPIRMVRGNALIGSLLVQFDAECALDEVARVVDRELAAVLATFAIAGDRRPDDQARLEARPESLPAPGPWPQPRALTDARWHVMSSDAVVETVGSSASSGLSPREAAARLASDGPNSLPRAEARSALSMLLDQFANAPVALLIASAALSVATGGLADALLIGGVLAANGLIGFLTERHAERTIDGLARTDTPDAMVIRDGARADVPVDTLVRGDLVMLSPGSYVPADVRVLAARHLTIDEATLTGESMPVPKSPDVLARQDTPLGDRRNMAYMSTLVTGGSGRGVVVATGTGTELGTIHTLVGTARAPETPMQRHLDAMSTQLAVLGTGVCAGVFALGLVHGYGALAMLLMASSLAVAAIPEGLPAVATTTLALGIRDMRRRRVLVRRLDAVENLGAIQVLCLDKTGTLTRNEMAVITVHANSNAFEIGPDGVWRAGGTVRPLTAPHLRALLEVGVLCNESEIRRDSGAPTLAGSATENALLALAMDAGVEVDAVRARHPLVDVRYRTERNRFMATLHGARDGHLLAVKGSPVEVLAMCRRAAHPDGIRDLDDARRTAILRANEHMAGQALRVLGLACGQGTSVKDGLTWLGLVGMTDPLRPGIPELIARFHRAGIETVMITGDQSTTAYAVGRQLGLSNGQPLEILDSESLERLDPRLLAGLAGRVRVFARVSPAHKLQIVRALQDTGKVVAMTGDGVNDAPALRAADVGVVVGDAGTELARSVADVVLDGDDLQGMLAAVRQGRTIRDNVRKSVHFLVSTNLSEIELVACAVAIGAGVPLAAAQLLWINLVTDVIPGIALALEPPDPDVLDRPPRDPHEPILAGKWNRIAFESGTMAAGALGSYLYGLARYGPGAQAGTCAFMSLTLGQLLHALGCRSADRRVLDGPPAAANGYFTAGLGACIGAQLLAIAFPPLRALLHLAPVGLLDALVIGAGAGVPFVVNDLTKSGCGLEPAAAFPVGAEEPA
jgi:Ca2+-transporting ATPase